MLRPYRFGLAAIIGSALSVCSAWAAAEDSAGPQLEEIVVTAEKVENTAQKTAISITAISGEDIDKQGRNDINDVLKDVPGVTLTNAAGGQANINIRGISSGALPNTDADPAASLNVDGSYASSLTGGASAISFFDVSRVEVLRGPQGTLYGRNAEAGAVNILTNNPTHQYDAGGSLEFGNYALVRGSGFVNIPLGDAWALRGAFTNINRRGYYTSGGDDAVASAGRVKLRYDNGQPVTFLVGAEYVKQGGTIGVGGMGGGVPAWGLGNYAGDPWDDVTKDGGLTGDVPGSSQDNYSLKLWSQLDWETGIGTFTVLPAQTHAYNSSISYAVPMGGTAGTYAPSPADGFANQTSVEARLVAPSTATLKYVVGAFYSKADSSATSSTFGLNTTTVDQKSKAVFGQATYSFTDTFRLIAGVRDTWDSKGFTATASPLSGLSGPASGDASWSRIDWKAGIESDLSANSLLYATLATGYRPGAINAGSSATVAGPTGPVANTALFTKPEELTSLEVGSKNQFLDNRVRVNGDVYYYDYKNRQYTNFNTNAPAGVPCPNGQLPLQFGPDSVCLTELNAAKVRMIGAEFETQWLFTSADTVGLTGAYLDAKADAPQDTILANGTTVDINGDTMPNSPKLQINGNYQHAFGLAGGRLTPRVDVRYTSKQYLGAFDYLQPGAAGLVYVVEAHTQYDLSLGFNSSDDKWNLNGYVKNVGNKAVKDGTDGNYTQVAAPRTFGVVLSLKM
ncbi:MAG TPA: TonB-dependent receptor [Steroidobacteraceae bacterium]|nr:TonB-dependent receptor [Steroidobacteraceae bacterium]